MSEAPVFRDAAGAKLNLGDYVAVLINSSYSGYIRIGKIEKFTPKMVTVRLFVNPTIAKTPFAEDDNQLITKFAETTNKNPLSLVKIFNFNERNQY